MKSALREIMNREIHVLSEESRYIGSCVDVGKGGAPVCDYFRDATELSNYISNRNRNEQISRDQFFSRVDRSNVPEGALDGETMFHAITHSPVPGETLSVEESSVYYIYNWDRDIHYFFEVQ